jgi:hypothetical protein
MYRRLGGPQGRSGRVRKISPPPGFGPRTFQPVASRYNEYAIPAHQRPFYPLQFGQTRFDTFIGLIFTDLCAVVGLRTYEYYEW